MCVERRKSLRWLLLLSLLLPLSLFSQGLQVAYASGMEKQQLQNAQKWVQVLQDHWSAWGFSLPAGTGVSLRVVTGENGEAVLELTERSGPEFRIPLEQENTADLLYSAALDMAQWVSLQQFLAQPGKGKAIPLTFSEHVYEYPGFSDTGAHFLYVSDRRTGNTNTWIRDMETGEHFPVVLPELAETFPVLVEGKLFFLQSGSSYWSLHWMDPWNPTGFPSVEIARGQINCIRSFGGFVFFSEGNVVFRVHPLTGQKYPEPFCVSPFPIQSFDVSETYVVVSALQDAQFDLSLFHLESQNWVPLTKTPANEMDVRFSPDRKGVLFSANPQNRFKIHYLGFESNTVRALSVGEGDDFYPCFLPSGEGVLFCRYLEKREPILYGVGF